MEPAPEHRDDERERWDFFQSIPDLDRSLVPHDTVKGSQLLQPLFEFSGACAGCGETPYLKLLTSSSATGSSSPTPPAARRSTAATCPPPRGRSDAERPRPGLVELAVRGQRRVRLGMRSALDASPGEARRLVERVGRRRRRRPCAALVAAQEAEHGEIAAQRERVA
jgi:pyruvate-ferredoxin/flavodoxin oxidoreductase